MPLRAARYQKEKFQSTPSVGRATLIVAVLLTFLFIFQSTPSVGRATRKPSRIGNQSFISIHALRGEGDIQAPTAKIAIPIFQSTPSVGRATFIVIVRKCLLLFQSTPSVGRATKTLISDPSRLSISIHALRGEGDPNRYKFETNDNKNFNPRPPWGGRHH